MTDFDNRINVGWWGLRIGLGVGPIITGIDKYFNKLADWGMYLSPVVAKAVPASATTFMHVVGVVEIIAGLIVLSRWTKLGGYIVMLWLLGIAVNLPATGQLIKKTSLSGRQLGFGNPNWEPATAVDFRKLLL
jgi:uncharacterized membrane protein YphA (DoxX/SURF4 family)